MTKLSVIIPLYKSAQFLPTLFENIVQQTIAADVEFVFVDDCGGDDSMQLARKLAGETSLKCIFTSTEANGGPGVARNMGLSVAGGEYVAFLDSDDRLDPGFCERLYKAAKAAKADLAYCHILAVKEGKSAVWRNPMVRNGAFAPDRLYFLKKYKSYFTSFIYRRDFILGNGICFPATRSAEDSCFLTEALLVADRIAAVDAPLYHYIYRPDSVSTVQDDGRWQQRMTSFDTLLDFARSKGLYDANKEILDYIYIKKAAIGAARNCPAARSEIVGRLASQIPSWRRNSIYRRDLKCRAAALLLGL